MSDPLIKGGCGRNDDDLAQETLCWCWLGMIALIFALFASGCASLDRLRGML